jgi:hypothetical protein
MTFFRDMTIEEVKENLRAKILVNEETNKNLETEIEALECARKILERHGIAFLPKPVEAPAEEEEPKGENKRGPRIPASGYTICRIVSGMAYSTQLQLFTKILLGCRVLDYGSGAAADISVIPARIGNNVVKIRCIKERMHLSHDVIVWFLHLFAQAPEHLRLVTYRGNGRYELTALGIRLHQHGSADDIHRCGRVCKLMYHAIPLPLQIKNGLGKVAVADVRRLVVEHTLPRTTAEFNHLTALMREIQLVREFVNVPLTVAQPAANAA